jgi:predicted KAP-like P-loop ATPase
LAPDDINRTVYPDGSFDRLPGRDFIGVEDDVAAFAHVICSSKTRTPIVLGIFGHWGAGKTFFMEKLYTACAGQSLMQIKFNAWHYARSNLWASLVEVVLKNLHNALGDSFEFNKTISELGVTIQVKQSLESEVNAARLRVEEADTLLTNVDSALRKAKYEVEKIEGDLKDNENASADHSSIVSACLRSIFSKRVPKKSVAMCRAKRPSRGAS